MSLSDAWLLWKLKHGDRSAAHELIGRHHAQVFGYLVHLGADRALAEDLTQETYLKAWRAVPALRLAGSIRPWLLTIARNEYLQKLRGRREWTSGLEEVEHRPAPDPSPLARLETTFSARICRPTFAGINCRKPRRS